MEYRKMHPRFVATFEYYAEVPHHIREGLWNYFAYGLEPGGFLKAVIFNDFQSALLRSDGPWSRQGLKDLAGWMVNQAPYGSYGSEEAYENWRQLTDEQRRDTMIMKRLRPSVIDILKGAPA